MILSVDCPVLDTGIGGTAHLEDLVLIGPTGATPLHDVPPNVLVCEPLLEELAMSVSRRSIIGALRLVGRAALPWTDGQAATEAATTPPSLRRRSC